MTASRDFTAFVQQLFAPLGAVSIRPIFGAAGVYSKGVMFGLVHDDAIYLKADSDSRKTFEARGSNPFVYGGKGKAVTTSYWKMPAELVGDSEEAVKWAKTAFSIAKAEKAATPPPSRRVTLGAARRHR